MVRFVVLAVVLCCLSACEKSASPRVEKPVPVPPAAVPPSDSGSLPANSASQAASSDVEVQLANHAQLLEKVEQFKGRVVVVDVWSTSCAPCKKEFPHLVELARRWPEDVVCISMNIDYIGLPSEPPESCLPAVKKFLSEQTADGDNMVNIASTEADEDVIKKLDIGSMPAILIFNRAGEQVSKLTTHSAGTDGLTYAGDVIPAVEKLVEQR